jgi:hypothetical protein
VNDGSSLPTLGALVSGGFVLGGTRGVASRYLLAFACLAAAGAVALAGVLDHRHKQQRENRAESAEWYCVHIRTQCGGTSAAGIEVRWERRERAYKLVLFACGAAALGSLALVRFRTQRA